MVLDYGGVWDTKISLKENEDGHILCSLHQISSRKLSRITFQWFFIPFMNKFCKDMDGTLTHDKLKDIQKHLNFRSDHQIVCC